MDLFFKDAEEALEFKSHIMVGMLNGSYKWDNGIVMRDAIDYYVANGGDFEKILQDKFGVTFDDQGNTNPGPGMGVCSL